MLETTIDTMIRQDIEWCRRRDIIQSIPGFAATIARTLIADLLELGSLNNKQVAALVVWRQLIVTVGTIKVIVLLEGDVRACAKFCIWQPLELKPAIIVV